MNVPGIRSELQAALDFVMLKTDLQRLAICGGAYGLLACLHGIPKGHQVFYLVHLALGIALIIEAVLTLVCPRPIHLIASGAMLVAMGGWINVMAMMKEGAGGSPTIFAIWGGVLVCVGMSALLEFRRFAYLAVQAPSDAAAANAGLMVKALLSVNPKKQQDIVILDVKLDAYGLDSVLPDLWHPKVRYTGRWRARLLPDSAVLVQNMPARALALSKADFAVSQLPEVSADLRIDDHTYAVQAAKVFSERLRNWIAGRCV